MSLFVDAARQDLLSMTHEEIHSKAAWAWASRALAALSLYKETAQLKWLFDASDYAHEAIEHSAFAGYNQSAIRTALESVFRTIPQCND